MDIKVAAFTESEKSINTLYLLNAERLEKRSNNVHWDVKQHNKQSWRDISLVW